MLRWRNRNRFRWLVEGSYESRLDLYPKKVDYFAEVVSDNYLDTVVTCSHLAWRLASTASGSIFARTPNCFNSHLVEY